MNTYKTILRQLNMVEYFCTYLEIQGHGQYERAVWNCLCVIALCLCVDDVIMFVP